jgi:hypothetical protein
MRGLDEGLLDSGETFEGSLQKREFKARYGFLISSNLFLESSLATVAGWTLNNLAVSAAVF